LKDWIANGAQLHIPTWSALIAEAALFLGHHERAGELLAKALCVSDRNGVSSPAPSLRDCIAGCCSSLGNARDCQSTLERPLALSRR
jgi:hypothetical protein